MLFEVKKKTRKELATENVTENVEEPLIEKLLDLAPKFFMGLVAAIYGYVILDTARQVIVEKNAPNHDG